MTYTTERHARVMAPSEVVYVPNSSTMNASVVGRGEVDRAALSRAFEALRAGEPTLAGRIKRNHDGYEILAPEGREVSLGAIRVRYGGVDEMPSGRGAVVDPLVELSAIDLAVEPGRFRLTLLVHHGVLDGYMLIKLLRRLLEQYAAVRMTGGCISQRSNSLRDPLETILEQRGYTDGSATFCSGVEEALRFAPVLPVSIVELESQEKLSQVWLWLTQDETSRLRSMGKKHGLSVTSLLTGVIVIALHQLAGAPERLVIPVLTVVSIRNRLFPPVSDDEGTVVIGTAGTTLPVTNKSVPFELGRQVSAQLRKELDSGLVQQSHARLPGSLKEFITPEKKYGLASKYFVGISNLGVVPKYPDPPGMIIENFQGISEDLTARDLGEPEKEAYTYHHNWFMALTYNGRLGLGLKIRKSDSVDGAENPIVKRIRSTLEKFIDQ